MRQEFDILDDDIDFTEKILLPDSKTFDDERKDFIRNLDTIDLQAVPGSGKTTALLAKLLIIEKKLPFKDGSGVLVLSHTNAAIDEIKSKIQKFCPRLFSYPNFIGTIQSFIDEFLAIPFYCSWKKKRPVRIDNEIYWESFLKFYPVNLRIALERRLGNNFRNFVEEILVKENTLVDFYTLEEKPIPRIGNTTRTYTELVNCKKDLLSKGILNFNDAYAFGNAYIRKHPVIKKILQQRFSFVFVDEMQDMDFHQYDMLEQIFFENGESISIFQRIGDKNQAIYNGDAKISDHWQDREQVLKLVGSHRLPPFIANLVNNLALHRCEGFEVKGLREETTIKPHIITYTNDTIENVIPCFVNQIKELCEVAENQSFKERINEIRKDGTHTYPIKIIAWNTEWKTEDERDNIDKIRLVDYFKSYCKEEQRILLDYSCLKSYLIFYDQEKKTLESIRKSILNALLRVLRIEGITKDDGRNISKKDLLKTLKQNSLSNKDDNYECFKMNLYQWSIGIVKGKFEDVYKSIIEYLPSFLKLIGDYEINKSKEFIQKNLNIEAGDRIQISSKINQVLLDEIEIEVTSIHSVKGQTHSATLYLESYYHSDGRGETAKSYESQRLAEQILGNPIDHRSAGVRVKQSAKMAFVGFSRATDLLCIAVHKNRFDRYLNSINAGNWEVIEA